MLADLTLVGYILVLAPAMLVGFYFARRKWFEPHHKFTMTTITIVNWVLIIALMIGTYAQGVLPNLASNLSNPAYLLPTLHLITGALAQFTATYLVIRMWFENQLPDALKIQNIKTPMRFTLAAWLVTVVLGVAIYLTFYTTQPAQSSDTPIATQEASATEEANASTSRLDDEPEAVETEEPKSDDSSSSRDDDPEAVETEEASG